MNRQTIYLCITVILVFLIMIPVVYMVQIALTPNPELFRGLFPNKLSLESFKKVILDEEVMGSYRNTWIICSGVTVITLVLASLAGYGFSRFNIGGEKSFVAIILLTQMLPMELLVISYFRLAKMTGLYNTLLILILINTSLALPFSLLIIKSIFDTIPKEIDDAARIDGCSRMGVLLRIILPLSPGGIAAAGAFAFLSSWVEFLYGLTLTTDLRSRPLTVQISVFLGRYVTQWDKMMAVSVLAVVPLIVVFVLLHDALIKGLTAGAVKE